MTNLKPVKEGFNKFCGPAVLSILTGQSTDKCAAEISKISRQYTVTGVQLDHLLQAAENLGFKHTTYIPQGSLYRTLTGLVNDDGFYIVTVANHFVVIEVKGKQIYFCDNHTKEPIKAASSARLMQHVIAVHKVWRDSNYVEPREPVQTGEYIEVRIDEVRFHGGGVSVDIERVKEFDITTAKRSLVGSFILKNMGELHEVLNQLKQIMENIDVKSRSEAV